MTMVFHIRHLIPQMAKKMEKSRKIFSITLMKVIRNYLFKKNNSLQLEESLAQEDRFFIALGHEYRRRILQYLGDNGSAGFIEIKQHCQTSTGTVYHHLDVLGN